MRKAIVAPANLSMVVGRGTVLALSGKEARLAINASFFDPPTRTICSNVKLAGTVRGRTYGPHPYLAVKDGRAWFGRGQTDALDCDWAAGAGPMLLEAGTKAPVLPGESYGPDIVPNGEVLRNKRMAVGLRPDGKLVLLTLEGSFGDLRRELLAAGCNEAMNLDGGGSAQWVERGQTLVGKDKNGYIRSVVNALVASRIEPATPVVTPLRPLRVYIDRSEQWDNTGTATAFGGRVRYVEGATMQLYALELARELVRRGCEVRLSDSEQHDLNKIAADANQWGADIVISLHTNAPPDNAPNPAQIHGTNCYIVARGGKAEQLGGFILSELSLIAGTVNRGLVVQNDCILRETDAPAVEIELDFHTCEASVLKLLSAEYLTAATRAVANAVDKYAAIVR